MSRTEGYGLFDTALGACGLAWSAEGLVAVLLPERDPQTVRARLARRHPEAAETALPPWAAQAAEAMAALLRGEPRGLADIPVDLASVGEFERRVYAAARAIPPGRAVTYGELAARIGEPGAAQAVGRALGRNPVPIVVPCHRIVAADGRIGGFSAPGGAETKKRILAIEGARLGDEPDLFG